MDIEGQWRQTELGPDVFYATRTARAAHALFEPVLLETARLQVKALAASMSPIRSSSDVAAELEIINAEANEHRKEVHSEMQNHFGCVYKGST